MTTLKILNQRDLSNKITLKFLEMFAIDIQDYQKKNFSIIKSAAIYLG